MRRVLLIKRRGGEGGGGRRRGKDREGGGRCGGEGNLIGRRDEVYRECKLCRRLGGRWLMEVIGDEFRRGSLLGCLGSYRL